MNLKDMLAKMSQLSEATDRSEPGKVKHSAEPGGYGRKDDEDDEGNKVKSDAPKKGKGRPKKDADASGETKKYDFSAFGVKSGKDVKLPKYDKKKSTIVKGKSQSHASNKVDDGTDPGEEPKTNKKGLKEYFDSLNKALLEAEQIEIKPASQIPPKPGQTSQPGQQQQVAGQAQKNTQVIQQGDKTLGTVNDPQLANQIKQSIGKGEMTLMPDGTMEEGFGDIAKKVGGAMKTAGAKVLDTLGHGSDEDLIKQMQKRAGLPQTGKKPEQQNKIKEAERPTLDSTMGAGLGAGRSQSTFEAKKPDANKNGIPDYAEDGKGKNDLKKKKDKIDEGMMDNIKGMLVPKLMKLLGPDAEKIASAVKQATGGDFTPSKENAIKVVKALGLDKAAAQGQSPQVAEDRTAAIAGNWQGKLHQALYTMGLLGSAGAATAMYGTVSGSWFATVGVLLLMFAGTFFGTAPGQIGAMGNFGNKGTSMQKGLDDHGMPIRNTNVDESIRKKKVKEGMDHKLQAARLEGKSHGLRKEGYNCRFDDMEEARMYHEGYKEGLDECYGQGGLGKVMGETDALPATVPGMASAAEPAMEDDMYEMDKTSYMKQQAIDTPGLKFKAFGQTHYDKDVKEDSPFAFEAWDNQLNSLLESNEQVNEGMTVSITKGQQGAPDSVSINAQDAEADKLLAFVKQAGLGIFGGDEAQTSAYGAPMSADAEGGSNVGGISVVDDHDGMMNLMKKLSGMGGEAGPQDSHDYEEEGSAEEHSHEHGEEETCNECGMAYEACGGNHVDKEMVEDDGDYDADEIGGPDDESGEEYIDQAEEEVAEAEEVVNNDDEANEENSDAVRDAALAQAADDNEKQVDEGEYANSDDDTFAADIDFMTNIISGGLNKKKSTGQTTIPVIAGQEERMTANESIVADWIKLAGIK
jgi:hypothetical protein